MLHQVNLRCRLSDGNRIGSDDLNCKNRPVSSCHHPPRTKQAREKTPPPPSHQHISPDPGRKGRHVLCSEFLILYKDTRGSFFFLFPTTSPSNQQTKATKKLASVRTWPTLIDRNPG